MLNRNQTIDDLRGICMLGVIAIHVGSFVLVSPAPNSLLYMFLEIISRYSVPAFFFISGYGLFSQYKEKPIEYNTFIKKRFCGVGTPYLTWSFFYLVYFSLVLPGAINWHPFSLSFLLFYGLACYHLYFMVILLWFYITFPLWQKLFIIMKHYGLKLSFTLLFIFQIIFNFWTCNPGIDVNQLPAFLQNPFTYRLNYLPLHYIFIFMLGGLISLYYQKFIVILTKKLTLISLAYILSISFICGSYYYYSIYLNYSLVSLVNSLQQLSLQGFLYTIASLIFFCAMLNKTNLKNPLRRFIHMLSVNSLVVYLIHPFWMDIIQRICHFYGIVMTTPKIIFIYFLLILISVLSSIIINKICTNSAQLSLLLLGKTKAKTN